MSPTLFGRGGTILKTLSTDGVTVLNTYYLPRANKADGMILTWKDLGKIKQRVDGSNRIYYDDTNKKFVPILTLNYSIYEDFADTNLYPIGIANNNTPTYDQLVTILDTYGNGFISVTPNSNLNPFVAILTKNIELKPINNTVYQSVQLEFTSVNAYPARNLNATVTL